METAYFEIYDDNDTLIGTVAMDVPMGLEPWEIVAEYEDLVLEAAGLTEGNVFLEDENGHY